MTGLTSTIPDALDALVAACQTIAAANPTLNISVYDAEASGANITDNVFVVGYEVRNWKSDEAGLGNLRRHEEYDIQMIALAHSGGEGKYNASAVRRQAFALVELVVQQLTTNPTLGAAVRFSEMIGADGGISRQGVSSSGGWSVEVEFGVRCKATLQQ